MAYKNRDAANAYRREWRKAEKAADPAWRESAHSKVNAYCKRRRETEPAYRESKNAYCRKWYAEHKTQVDAKNAAYRQRFPAESKVQTLRADAATRGLEYTLDPRLARDLVTDNCFYCGAAPIPVNGIDRVDNSRGYVEDNVVSCCTVCNTAKLDKSLLAFTGWVARAYAHQERYFRA